MEAGKSVQEKIVLSDPEYIKKLFPESFVLFKPQNGIISGDFYRFKETKSGKKLFAAVDCTGHGIPGAFMSFIGSQILNEAVEYGLEKPSDILSFLDKKIIDIQSEQKDEDTFAKYGMDIALCSRDEQTKTLEYS
jgi:serine phosphatase RsbU (regulator of sigma subunit)